MTSRQDVSGGYAGVATRLVAHVVDLAVVGALFVFGLASLDYVLRTIAGLDLGINDPARLYGAMGAVWLFTYWWLSIGLAGKTIGKALMGLRVVSREGQILSFPRSAVRAAVLPFSYALFGLGFVGIILGKERRALHDVIAGSAVIYDWGDRTAELPTPLSAYVSRKAVEMAEADGE